MIRAGGPNRKGKTVAADQPVSTAHNQKAFTWKRIAGLLVTVVLLTGLVYLGVSSSPDTVSVAKGCARRSAGHAPVHVSHRERQLPR